MRLIRSVVTALTSVLLSIALPIALAAQGSVSVTPDGGSTSASANTSGNTVQFTVTNTGGWQYEDWFSFGCSRSGAVSSCSVSPSSAYLMSTEQTTVTVTYSTGAAGSGTVTLSAWGLDYGGYDTGYYNVTVTGGSATPPSNWDVSPYNYDNQDMSRCAAGCFAATYAHSTVPYFSLDTPRSVTLVYNGARVNPKPFIHLNVQKPSGYSNATQVWMQVKRNSTWQFFTNDTTVAKFAAASSGWQRIGVQLRDSTLATGMYDIEIKLIWRDNTSMLTEQAWTTKLMVVNESASSIASGWTIAGVQRLYVQSDGSALITEGDGSAVYFRKNGSSFTTPNGDFSKLVTYGTGWRRLYSDSTDVRFNSGGYMTDVYDQFDNRTVFDQSGGTLYRITDAYGKYITFVYGDYGLAQVYAHIYPYRSTYYTVDSNKRLTQIKDPDNNHSDFGYDASRRLVTVTDRLGKTTTLGYDSQSGTLLTVTTPSVPIYNVGTVPLVTRDTAWQRVGVPYSTATMSVLAPSAVYGTTIAPDGAVTKFTVDRFGQQVVSKFPYGGALQVTVTNTLDSNGLLTRTINSADAADTTHVKYNSAGLVTWMRRTGTTADTIVYGAWAQPVQSWGTDKVVSSSWLGTNGRVDSTSIGGVKTRYTYDSRGRVLTVRDGLNNLVQTNVYSGTNENLSSVARPGGRITTFGYDAYGRRTTATQAGLPTRTTYYDVLNRADSVRDGVNSVATRFGHNALRDTIVTDPSGRTFRTGYNDVGWVVRRTDPAGESDYYRYSRDGELMSWINRRGDSTNFAYDSLGRQTSKMGDHTDTTLYSYSTNGRELTATSRVSTETAYLSVLGQPDSIQTVMGGKTYWVRHNYSAAGVIDSTWATSTGSATFLGRRYLWTPSLGRLDNIRVGGKTTSLSYNSNQQLTSITYPGSHVVGQQYTTGHMKAKVETNQSPLDVLVRRLEYDTAGRVRNQYTPPVPVEFGTVLGYDGLNRLVRDTMGMIESDECTWDSNNGYECPAPTTDSVRSFVYDAIGNVGRDSLYRVGGGYTLATGTYNSTTGRITSFGGCSYSTDYDGNVFQRSGCGSTVDFYWSSENRLDSLAVSGQKIRNYYDAAGRLVKRDVYGTVKYYLWNGDNLLAEIDNSGAKIAEYSYWPGGLDHLHALVVDTTVYFAHRDGFGNVVGLVNESKQLKARYTYDAWGKLVWSYDGASFGGRDRARFKGALWMGEEGPELYYMRNRWYETHSGRFLSEDPIGLAGGINLYAFARNNPISGSDPTGLYGEMDDRSMFDAHSPSDRDVYFPFGGESVFWYSGGGVGSGIMDGSAIYSNTRCGGRLVLMGATPPTKEFLTYACGAARALHGTFIATGDRAGTRTRAECKQMVADGYACHESSLHLIGQALDFYSTGRYFRNNIQLALDLARYVAIAHPDVSFEIGFYTSYKMPNGQWNTGYVHFGVGRQSRYGKIRISAGRSINVSW